MQTIRLCSHSANYAILPGLFTAALGHQHALGDRHRLCRWRRDWLLCGGNHTQGGYQQYATALWVVAIVIILVDYISAQMARSHTERPTAR